ncbi:MAG: hypothetical protein H7335_10855 [Massilia sp.]|nr:hypothetical protein [Massilia sp.]
MHSDKAQIDLRFINFVAAWRWVSALIAVMYHVRFLMFVPYDSLLAKTVTAKSFYFITGLGHESFAVFFVADGIAAALALRSPQSTAAPALRLIRAHLGAYPIILSGLLVGAALDLLGSNIFNGTLLYSDYPAYTTVTLTLSSFFGNMFMLQPFFVATFGSNAMLHFLSYRWWSSLLLSAFLATNTLPRLFVIGTCAALVFGVLLAMPYRFIPWLATWLLGFAVVTVHQPMYSRSLSFAGLALFFVMVFMSRMIGSHEGLLPQPFGYWLILWKYFFVGAGFAAFAWTRKRPCLTPASRPPASYKCSPHVLSNDAFALFFFHFPLVMFVIGLTFDYFHQKLMQQPSTILYAEYVAVIVICWVFATVIARLSTARSLNIYADD